MFKPFIFATALLLLTAMLISACDTPVKQKEAQKLQEETNKRMVIILNNMENLQTQALKDHLDDHESRRYYINGKSFSKDKLLKHLESSYGDLESQKFMVLDPRFNVLCHNSVLWCAEISTLAVSKDGETNGNYQTVSWLWQKINDRWRVTHFNLSSSQSKN